MQVELLRRADQIFAEALELAPSERASLLLRETGTDQALRAQVERLLVAEARLSGFLEPSPPAVDADLPPGTRLGPYTVVGLLGRGGMGAVYLAERADQQYQHEVAVKVLRADLTIPSASDRFRAERQLLADLDHPGIARLLDGGSLDDGRPYLVMERVEGLPLDQHCDRHRLDVERRLGLFLRVLAAVQWAHQSLLAHRDLKPANILVTAEGEPKLLDFGVAKLLAGSGSGTGFGSAAPTELAPMTPSYASPEQVRGEAVGTTTDVYSLGVLLYELLTGVSPYGEAVSRPETLLDAICHREPALPSQAVLDLGRGRDAAAVAALAERRASQPRVLSRRLAGDLDNIVGKALAKEPARRYASAAELARDLELHLAGQPVVARASTLSYLVGKFVRRHQLGVVLAAAALLALVGLVLGLWMQQAELRRERDKATAALAFLVETFSSGDPYHEGEAALTAQELLERGARRLSLQPPEEPRVEAALLDAIGRSLLGLGLPDPASPLLERSLEVHRGLYGERHAAAAGALEALALLQQKRGEYELAEKTARQALALRQSLATAPSPELATALNLLGSVLGDRARYEEALARHRDALEVLSRGPAKDTRQIGPTLVAMAGCLRELGRFDEAAEAYGKALETEAARLGDGHPSVARLKTELALVHLDRGEAATGEAMLRAALEAQRRVLPARHPDLTATLNNLALALQHQGRFPEAAASYREVVERQRQHLGLSPVILARTLNNFGSVLTSLGRQGEALAAHREALELNRGALGPVHDQLAFNLMQLARASWRPGHEEEAIALEREALEVLERLFEGQEHPTLAYPLSDLGRMFVERGRAAEAEPHLRRALGLHEKFRPPGHWEIALTRSSLGHALWLQQRLAEAEPLLVAGYEGLLAAGLPAADHRVGRARGWLIELYSASGRSFPEPVAP